jgi:hypothetical protein
MWEPRRLTTLWTFTTCYGDIFTFFTHILNPLGGAEIDGNDENDDREDGGL